VKRAARVNQGSVVFNKRFGTWNFLWCENGHRRSKVIGTAREFPTKASAWRAAEPLRRLLEKAVGSAGLTVRNIVEQFRQEKMPQRYSTRLGYDAWLNNHIVPRWGDCILTELQARPVELWLQSLPIAPKSRVHVRGLIRALWDYAMWRGDVPTERNPMELVTIKGATKRKKQPRSLSVAEFQQFIVQLEEPVRTLALVCVCFGLRISECLALRWSDVDWLNGKLRVERAIVRQRVDDVKTIYSGRLMSVDADMLAVLKAWRQTTQFSGDEDWIFASPSKLGRLPLSYPWVWLMFQKAAAKAGIGSLGTHSLRHSYRSWLDAVGTPIAVQQKLMRHSDIRTTLNIYGDVVTDEMAQAHSKVVRLAIPRAN
jgi:integrase